MLTCVLFNFVEQATMELWGNIYINEGEPHEILTIDDYRSTQKLFFSQIYAPDEFAKIRRIYDMSNDATVPKLELRAEIYNNLDYDNLDKNPDTMILGLFNYSYRGVSLKASKSRLIQVTRHILEMSVEFISVEHPTALNKL